MQWKHKTSPAPKKAKKVMASSGKVMASVFWDAKSIWMMDYFRKSCTINENYFANSLRQLRRDINAAGMLTKGVLFHQDNAKAHKSLVAMSAICDCGFDFGYHPFYSPGFGCLELLSLLQHEKNLSGKRHQSYPAVEDSRRLF